MVELLQTKIPSSCRLGHAGHRSCQTQILRINYLRLYLRYTTFRIGHHSKSWFLWYAELYWRRIPQRWESRCHCLQDMMLANRVVKIDNGSFLLFFSWNFSVKSAHFVDLACRNSKIPHKSSPLLYAQITHVDINYFISIYWALRRSNLGLYVACL